VLFLLAAAVVVWQVSAARGAVPIGQTEIVRLGTLETYYSFSGNIAVKERRTVSAKSAQTVREVYVTEEQRVAAGAPLLRLSNGEILRAEIGGEVADLTVEAGSATAPGAPLMTLVDFDDLQVLLKIDEFDVHAVSVGMKAAVTVDALGLTFTAPIEHIGKQAQTTGSVSYYEARLAAPRDTRLLPGMKTDVKVLAARVENAALLPVSALRFNAYNQPYVHLLDGSGGTVERPVTVGLQDGTTAQILEGLAVGDVAALESAAAGGPFWRAFRRAR
jgi:HlyD family secretion protein